MAQAPVDLHSLVEEVHDEATFIEFLKALMRDRIDEVRKEAISPSDPYGPGANGWENGSIEQFLDAAAAWGEASKDGLIYYTKPENPWRRCAHILFAGKFYE